MSHAHITPRLVSLMREARKNGVKVTAVALDLGVSRATVSKYTKPFKEKTNATAN